LCDESVVWLSHDRGVIGVGGCCRLACGCVQLASAVVA
jgi:hypothetical protein